MSRGPGSITRRSFLRRAVGLAIGGAASILAVGAAPALLRIGRPVAPGARLAAVLPHSDSAGRIGRAALAGGLVERDVRGLMAGLAGSIPDVVELLRDGSDDDVRATLDAARHREFAARGAAVLRIDGWIVAPTEARACALIALA